MDKMKLKLLYSDLKSDLDIIEKELAHILVATSVIEVGVDVPTGLFPEQAANWDWFSDLIRKAGRPC